MKMSLYLFKVRGIPIGFHLTFLFILPVFGWLFASFDIVLFGMHIGFRGLDMPFVGRVVLGMFTAFMFFLTVLAHELGHAMVALEYGMKIRSILLMMFGGVASIEINGPQKPIVEATMSIAGPMVSVSLGFGLYLAALSLTGATGLALETIACFVGTLGFYNIVLAFFNMIPAFPMDGGRVLRALLAVFTNFKRATTIAADVGKGFSLAMGFLGFISGSFWLILLAVFLFLAASGEEKATREDPNMDEKKDGKPSEDIGGNPSAGNTFDTGKPSGA